MRSNRTNDIVLTGLPRSGTTLVCHLLNRLPNIVALHEPMEVGKIMDLGGEDDILDGIEQFYYETRRLALDGGVVVSKHVGGKIPDNHFEQRASKDALRPSMLNKGNTTGAVPVGKELSSDFLLGVKHPAMFSALLPVLTERFPAYAVIRNPLSVLASWNSVDANTQRGHSPVAERLDSDLQRELAFMKDRVERQLHLMSWWYDRFRRALPDSSVIRYEEIVASRGKALSAITPAAEALDEPLSSQNLNASYDHEEMRLLGKRLLNREGAYWHFYTRESVEEILEEIPEETWLKRTLAQLLPRGRGGAS